MIGIYFFQHIQIEKYFTLSQIEILNSLKYLRNSLLKISQQSYASKKFSLAYIFSMLIKESYSNLKLLIDILLKIRLDFMSSI